MEKNHSIYHPNIHQIKILYSLADKFATEFGLEPHILRMVMIEASIRFQEETQLFFYQHIYEIYAFRVSNTQLMTTWMLERLTDLLENPTESDKSRLAVTMDKFMKYYIEEFAGKKYERD